MPAALKGNTPSLFDRGIKDAMGSGACVAAVPS